MLIEDEPSFVEALTTALGREGYVVDAETDGRAALDRFRRSRPDLIILDLMLPGLSGLDVLRAVRAESEVPVIVVSAKDAEADVVAALELGADDYVTKPYSVRELIARLRAAIRRSALAAGDEVLTAGSATLELGSRRLILGGRAQDLPRKEFDVLLLLMEQPGRVVTREEFLDRVWGYAWEGESTRTLDQHIRRLRRRLEEDPRAPRIETARGVGYRLVV